MKGDFTRSTFRSRKHYSGVRQQQGRVQLDADWNEQADIDAYRRETSLADVIGPCGAPWNGGGFKAGIAGAGEDLSLSPGHLYVDGILCELEPPGATYTTQYASQDPKLGEKLKPGLPTEEGPYFVYLDAWQRHVTALEDPSLREKALGGPDTATRTQTFWQVKLFRVPVESHCLSSPLPWQAEIAPPTGRLAAQAPPSPPSENPCIVPANAGYTRLENQLYRVEVHKGGNLGTATFKWSRDNGSVVASWLAQDAQDPKRMQVAQDKAQAFAGAPWVELTDDTREVEGRPGLLVKLLKPIEGDVLVLDVNPATVKLADFPVNPKIRRWDSDGERPIEQPASGGGWLNLEDGIQVRFEDGTYRTGDYWLIPARAFIGEFSGDIVDWPQEGGKPAAVRPHGVDHHICKIAVVGFDAAKKKFKAPVLDCRPLFPAATELIRFFHVGGEGQEGLPGEKLPCFLEVGVTNGQWPVEGARVVFSGGGTGGFLTPSSAKTGPDGIARCQWTLPPGRPGGPPPCLTVTATLQDAAGKTVSIPLVFHAHVCRTLAISYVGGDGQEAEAGEMLPQPLEVRVSNCRSPQAGAKVRFTIVQDDGSGRLSPDLTGAGAAHELILQTNNDGLASCFWRLDGKTPSQRVEATLLGDDGTTPVAGQVIHFNASFQERGKDPGIKVQKVISLGDRNPLDNDTDMSVSRLSSGIQVLCDRKVADVFTPKPAGSPFPAPARPNVQVILYTPFPPGENFWDFNEVAGFHPILLAGQTSAVEKDPATGAVINAIQWAPTASCKKWLDQVLFDRLISRKLTDRVLVRLILEGNFIWSAGDPDLFLDGETLSKPGSGGHTDRIGLRLPSTGDGLRGGDFRMWFWLTPEPSTSPFDLLATVQGDTVSGVVRGIPTTLGINIFLTDRVENPVRPPQATTVGKPVEFKTVPPGLYSVWAVLSDGRRQSQDVEVKPTVVGPGRPPTVVDRPPIFIPPGLAAEEEEERPAGESSARKLTDVPGIGRARAARLAKAGVKEAADLGEMSSARLAEVLDVAEEQAEALLKNARKLLEGSGGPSGQ